jgi:hypothetical protein
MADQVCPLKRGDRVRHKLFGLGTVSGKPVESVSGDLKSGGSVPAEWIVPVEWDDKNRTANRVAHTHLEKVSA